MRIRTKLLLVLVPLFLISTGLMTLFSQTSVQAIVEQEEYRRGLSVATGAVQNPQMIAGFRAGKEKQLLPLLQAMLEHGEAIYIIALNRAGVVLAHTNVAETGKTYTDPITMQVLKAEQSGYRRLDFETRPVLDVSFPVWDLAQAGSDEAFLLLGEHGEPKTRLGTLRLGLPLTNALETANRISTQMFWIIAVVSGLTLLLILFFSQRFLQPIRRLAEAAERLGQGALGETVQVRSKDEIGDLAERFNRMSVELAETTVSKDYTDNILRSMNDTLIVVSPEGIIESANAAAANLLGYAPDELTGRPVATIFSAGGKRFFEALITQNMVRQAAIRNIEQTYLTKDGREIPVLFSGAVMQNEAGHVVGIVCAARDITDLKESQERFRRLSESAFEGIIIHEGGRILDANERLAKVLGYSHPNDIIGMNGWQFIPREARRLVLEKMRADNTRPFESLARTRDGTVFPVEVIGGSVPYQGRRVGVVAIRDIRERKEAEVAQRQLERQLIQSERMASVGTVAAGIVHNLKNPLTGILGFADLLQMKHPEMQEVEKILTSANQMNEMVENILAKSRHKKTAEAIDINKLLEQELDFLQADRGFKRDVSCEASLAANLPSVQGVYSEFSQIFGNLLRNAVEAMHNRELKKLGIKTYDAEKQGIVVEVTDTGCGIEEEHLTNLFEPFFTTKTGNGDNDGPRGTGLGLYMVRRLLYAHGGTIEVESQPNVGTTFRVRLPIIEAET